MFSFSFFVSTVRRTGFITEPIPAMVFNHLLIKKYSVVHTITIKERTNSVETRHLLSSLNLSSTGFDNN